MDRILKEIAAMYPSGMMGNEQVVTALNGDPHNALEYLERLLSDLTSKMKPGNCFDSQDFDRSLLAIHVLGLVVQYLRNGRIVDQSHFSCTIYLMRKNELINEEKAKHLNQLLLEV